MAAEANKLTAECKARFVEIRNNKAPKKPAAMRRSVAKRPVIADESLAAFRDEVASKLKTNIQEVLYQKTIEDLRELSDYYGDLIHMFTEGFGILDAGGMGFEPDVLGLKGWRS